MMAYSLAYTALAILAMTLTTTAARELVDDMADTLNRNINSSGPLEFVNYAGRTIKSTVANVKQPIDQSVAYIGSSQCTTVKRLVGVDYVQIKGVTEPDVDSLTLNFITREFTTSFTLGSAAATLPQIIGIDPRRPLVIFMHGFVDDRTLFAFPIVNDAFQSIGDFNIVGLDASPLIRFLYLRASTYVRFIGEKLGATLAAMVQAGLNPKDIYLVGHSLGSHISGFAGKTFQNLTRHQVGRISGLDPAGPCFTHVDDDVRLKASDAEFVDVIHTDGGVYGLKNPVGDVDFFPNGGEQQPSCVFQFCSHLRVVELFAESVRNSKAFPARPRRRCDSWDDFVKDQCSGDTGLMGYGCKKDTAEGLYYLQTRDEPPFALSARSQKGGIQGLVGQLGRLAGGL